jgi:hypothetical protein
LLLMPPYFVISVIREYQSHAAITNTSCYIVALLHCEPAPSSSPAGIIIFRLYGYHATRIRWIIVAAATHTLASLA